VPLPLMLGVWRLTAALELEVPGSNSAGGNVAGAFSAACEVLWCMMLPTRTYTERFKKRELVPQTAICIRW
jgi:hypothetical protein